MSVFGGDSWGREAQYRKRRLEVVVTESLEGSSYKRLSNGKYACLICPQNPVLDSLLMLSTHCKGSRHRAAESRLKERELARQEEMNKRIALAGSIGGHANSTTCSKKVKSPDEKTVIGQAQKVACEDKAPMQHLRNKTGDANFIASHAMVGTTSCQLNVVSSSCPAKEASDEEPAHRFIDYRAPRKRAQVHGCRVEAKLSRKVV